MGMGYLVLPFVVVILYGIPLYFFFKKAKNKRQKIISLAIPIVITLSVVAYGFIDDWTYDMKLKKYPEFSHITFKDSVIKVKNSIITFKSVLKKLPYWMEGRPISFQELLFSKYIDTDSVFYDKTTAINNIRFLQENGINSIELDNNCIFMIYYDSLSTKEGLYYRLLQVNDDSPNNNRFRVNAFDTIDYNDGLYLLSKNPLN